MESLWEKEKMLVTSTVSFFHNVYQSLFPLGYLTRAVTKCDLIPPNILYTDGHTDGWTNGQKDRLIPVYPRKHSFCGGINNFNNSLLLETL